MTSKPRLKEFGETISIVKDIASVFPCDSPAKTF